MPSRNTIKVDAPESYYHIYARGVGRQTIFLDPNDFAYFQALFARYLSLKPAQGKFSYNYPNYRSGIQLLAYCLMSNHFHLLVYQHEAGYMTSLMRSLMTSYTRYFNLKYKRTGSLFESVYRASMVDQQRYLEHISRYIHLNPRYWKRYPYSSLKHYRSNSSVEWLQPEKILELFQNEEKYISFLEDYEEYRQMLKEIKHLLAN